MPDLTYLAGGFAAACSIGSMVPFVRGIVRHGKRPRPTSWAIWAALCIELTIALAAAGGRAQLGLPAAEAAGCTLIAVLAWRGAARRAGRALDDEPLSRPLTLTLLAGCAAALLVGLAAGPVAAALLLIAVDFAALIPTVLQLWHDPNAEPLNGWRWYAAGEVGSLGAAAGSGWIFWTSASSGLVIAGTILSTARYGRWRDAKPPARHAAPRPARPPRPPSKKPTWRMILLSVTAVLLVGAAGEALARWHPAQPAAAQHGPTTPAAALAPPVHSPGPLTPAAPTRHHRHRDRDRDEYYAAATTAPPMAGHTAMPGTPTLAAPVPTATGTFSPTPVPPPSPTPRPTTPAPSPTPAPTPSPTYPTPSPSETYPSTSPPYSSASPSYTT